MNKKLMILTAAFAIAPLCAKTPKLEKVTKKAKKKIEKATKKANKAKNKFYDKLVKKLKKFEKNKNTAALKAINFFLGNQKEVQPSEETIKQLQKDGFLDKNKTMPSAVKAAIKAHIIATITQK